MMKESGRSDGGAKGKRREERVGKGEEKERKKRGSDGVLLMASEARSLASMGAGRLANAVRHWLYSRR